MNPNSDSSSTQTPSLEKNILDSLDHFKKLLEVKEIPYFFTIGFPEKNVFTFHLGDEQAMVNTLIAINTFLEQNIPSHCVGQVGEEGLIKLSDLIENPTENETELSPLPLDGPK